MFKRDAKLEKSISCHLAGISTDACSYTRRSDIYYFKESQILPAVVFYFAQVVLEVFGGNNDNQ